MKKNIKYLSICMLLGMLNGCFSLAHLQKETKVENGYVYLVMKINFDHPRNKDYAEEKKYQTWLLFDDDLKKMKSYINGYDDFQLVDWRDYFVIKVNKSLKNWHSILIFAKRNISVLIQQELPQDKQFVYFGDITINFDSVNAFGVEQPTMVVQDNYTEVKQRFSNFLKDNNGDYIVPEKALIKSKDDLSIITIINN